MKLRAALCCCLFLASSALARESTDVIVMKNGDHLTGEIKGLNQGVLYISMNYILGTSDVQWSKVDHIESNQLFLVKTEDGVVYTGTLSTADVEKGRPMTIEVVEASARKVNLEREKVIQMDTTSEHFWERFNGSINSGISYSKGNQSTQYNLSSDVVYPRERWQAGASYNSTLSTSTGVTATHPQSTALWTRNACCAGTTGFMRVRPRSCRARSRALICRRILAAAWGVCCRIRTTQRFTCSAGFGWQRTQYAPNLAVSNPQQVFTGLVGTGVRLFRFNKTTLDTTITLLPAITQPGRLYTNLNATYYIKISGALSWNVSFYGNWDNQPPPTFSGSDYGTSSGLSITFGNRVEATAISGQQLAKSDKRKQSSCGVLPGANPPLRDAGSCMICCLTKSLLCRRCLRCWSGSVVPGGPCVIVSFLPAGLPFSLLSHFA